MGRHLHGPRPVARAQAEPTDESDQGEGEGSDDEGEGESGFGGQCGGARRQVLDGRGRQECGDDGTTDCAASRAGDRVDAVGDAALMVRNIRHDDGGHRCVAEADGHADDQARTDYRGGVGVVEGEPRESCGTEYRGESEDDAGPPMPYETPA